MGNKVISFAIPCYNSAEYMSNYIEHLLKLNSEDDDIEIIIIDDGSTKDNTLEIAKSFEKKFPTTIKAIHQENGGHGQAVNTGLKNATGVYFKVVDSDDWLDVDNSKKVLDYCREQAKNADKVTPTDMVIANYVYNKVHENIKQPMNYNSTFPVEKLFSWRDVKHFKIGHFILMHSVIYRTQLLKDINLVLPKHTFYVDNIFVYVPLPYVRSMYYIDTDMYMYYIGREDQSVNESVMLSRVDQQLKITKIMIDNINYDVLRKQKKLCKYMISYLAIMMCICSVFLRMEQTKENEEKLTHIWEYLKKKNMNLYKDVHKYVVCWGTNLPGKIGRKIALSGYHLTQKLFQFN